MAPASSASSASEGADDTVYQAKLASSLAGLPVRQGQPQHAQQQQHAHAQQQGLAPSHAGGAQQQLADARSSEGSTDTAALDLAVSFILPRSHAAPSALRALATTLPPAHSALPALSGASEHANAPLNLNLVPFALASANERAQPGRPRCCESLSPSPHTARSSTYLRSPGHPCPSGSEAKKP